MSTQRYTIGSDPEFFVTRDNVLYPAYNVIKGTKEHPTHLGDGYDIRIVGNRIDFFYPFPAAGNLFNAVQPLQGGFANAVSVHIKHSGGCLVGLCRQRPITLRHKDHAQHQHHYPYRFKPSRDDFSHNFSDRLARHPSGGTIGV